MIKEQGTVHHTYAQDTRCTPTIVQALVEDANALPPYPRTLRSEKLEQYLTNLPPLPKRK